MNFIEEYKKGQSGKNKGLFMGKGLANISNFINGIQKKRMYGVGAGPKVGKSTFVDYGFVIEPYLYALENNLDVEWIYYSFEIDRVSKEFDFAAFFLYHDYGILNVQLDEGITVKGESVIELSSNYLRGRLLDDNGKVIVVKENIFEALQKVYIDRIVPLFGEWSDKGTLITPGKIEFIEEKDNPTGIYKDLKKHAAKNGHFITNNVGRVIGYNRTSNADRHTIVIIDHMRKLRLERGFLLKQTVDKMSEYMVELRNWCDYTFVPIIHTNRNLADTGKLSFAGDELFPTSDDVKDTGNLAEDCDFFFTMFNPNDDKYKLKKHFKVVLRDSKNNLFYPDLRTVHLVESRHTFFPKHFKTRMLGNVKAFEQINL